jgi:hypothetical protein
MVGIGDSGADCGNRLRKRVKAADEQVTFACPERLARRIAERVGQEIKET